MIFVTVGTHEQQFNRLVEYMDLWKKQHDEEVVIQTGFSSYKPRYACCADFFSYTEMGKYIQKARIVITHGGPSSFIAPLQIGKVPIVVPRKKEYGEHINNHQVTFCREVKGRYNNIILVENIDDLDNAILRYESDCSEVNSGINTNNKVFCEQLEAIIDSILE